MNLGLQAEINIFKKICFTLPEGCDKLSHQVSWFDTVFFQNEFVRLIFSNATLNVYLFVYWSTHPLMHSGLFHYISIVKM